MIRLGGRFRIRAALFLGVGLGLTGIVLIAYGAKLLKPWELDTVDARYSIRGSHEPPVPMAVVAIDNQTFIDLQVRWQDFKRAMHGKVIDRLRRDGARVIAYDIQFTEPSGDTDADILDDNALIDAVARTPNKVVLGTEETDGRGGSNVFGGEKVLRQIRAHSGNVRFPEDQDGVKRRMPYSVDGLKAFSIVAAELVAGRKITRNEVGGDEAWIEFLGPPETVPLYSFSDVWNGDFKQGTFRGAVVVVGATAASLHDVHATAVGPVMSGPELQANAIATALAGFPLHGTPEWFDFALILLVGLVVPIAGLRLSFRGTLVFSIAAAALFLVATQVAFNSGRVITFVYPFLALVLSTIGALGAYYVLSIFERQRTRDTFARFVPETVVDQLLAQSGKGHGLATTEVYGTCMFTDIRGFTTFSEHHPALQVIDVLNRYLAEMSDAILSHGGTLASFLGDGFMAVFGAPIEQPDHADRALAAAREIVEERLPRFNAALEAEGAEGFKMGIGLNSGPFMSGNVGSQQRLQYTVIGDTINTASRIEGLTKGTQHVIFLADSTREALVNPPRDLLYVDEFEIRGRQSRVKLWSITGTPAGAPAPEPAPAAAGALVPGGSA
jgi:adenylate cyclase